MFLEHRITVDAPVERAYAVLMDVARWPEFMSALAEVRILNREGDTIRVEMREAAGRMRDVPEYLIDFPPPHGMRAVMTRGMFRSGEVRWTLHSEEGHTRVVVEHRFESGRRGIGALVDRWLLPRLVHRVVSRSLSNFKTLVETGRSPKLKERGASFSPSPVPFQDPPMIHTENRVVVRAPAEDVYAVAEDKAAFPSFIPHVLTSEEIREEGRVKFRMAARMKYGFVSRWVSERTAAEPGAYAEYRTEGFCRRMGGRWTVEALPAGDDGAPRTRLTLTHDFEVGHPVLGLFLPVDRLVRACVEDNSQKMLEAIRARVESRSEARNIPEVTHV